MTAARNIAIIDRLLAQSETRGKKYRARMDRADARGDAKETFIASTLRAREAKVYRRLMAEKAQLESLKDARSIGWDWRVGSYVALPV